MTLTIVVRSCLSYVVEYVLNLDSVPTGPIEAPSLLADALVETARHDRSPVLLPEIVDVLRSRGNELLDGERVAMSANELGETVHASATSRPPASATAAEITASSETRLRTITVLPFADDFWAMPGGEP